MGFLNALFGRTGPGKLAAAKNALAAKHMFLSLSEEEQRIICAKTAELLVAGGIPLSQLQSYAETMPEGAYYGMVAMAFSCYGMDPSMSNLFPGGRWNSVDNPLVALTGASDEIVLAINEIKRKYGVTITIST
ncbi:hypothetical protein [Geobacter sp. AOG1]|uniref:hypothetical protein n=1 Tax=Geobacter sp. AOG1 TaxID=1566346 RepID=UPI001CC6A4C2|nr:hypothetical protein [Geobacter sp. AOG1]GFE56412.1 hypothetical protein AOG1_02910 [Geobacter sp. AOG1]